MARNGDNGTAGATHRRKWLCHPLAGIALPWSHANPNRAMHIYLIVASLGLTLASLLTCTYLLPRLDSSQGPIQYQPIEMAIAAAAARLPALYLAHGGGPFPVLGEPGHLPLSKFMTRWPSTVPRPAAILVVSAHFEASTARVTSGPSPPLIYDYYGFPEEAYSIKYPSPGDPPLASKVADALKAAGFDCVLDAKRGFDHGHFIPLKLMYPQADIPTVQLSLLSSLDPEDHIRMGESLAPLREQGVLVLGSGLSFHNMAAFDFRGRGHAEALSRSKEFDEYLQDAMTNPAYSWAQRRQRLVDWAQAPAARFCHPREEHLLPLMVAFGASKGEEVPAKSVFHDKLLGVWVSSFEFGAGGLAPPSVAA